eukprot:8885999-Pyramimonas_sp.AAC.1
MPGEIRRAAARCSAWGHACQSRWLPAPRRPPSSMRPRLQWALLPASSAGVASSPVSVRPS